MAISISSKPKTHTPAYNEQYYVLNSDNKSQPNFFYVCDVNINGDTVTVEVPARPDSGLGYFNPQRIVESYVLNTFDNTANKINVATNSIKEVKIDFSEKYGTPPVTQSPISATDTYYAWNASYGAHEYNSYAFPGTEGKLLNPAPLTSNSFFANEKSLRVYNDQRYVFGYWHRAFGPSNLRKMQVVAFDKDSNPLKTTVIDNTFHDVSVSYTRNLVFANVSKWGFDELEAFDPGQILSGGFPVIPAGTKFYEILFLDSFDVINSERLVILIEDYCGGKYRRWGLTFLDRFGGYTSFPFTLASRENSTFTRSDYRRIPFELVGSDLVYRNYKHDRIQYKNLITNRITLTSDWITEGEAIMLKDLIGSPDVKLEDENGDIFAVHVSDTTYEVEKKANKKLFNLTINLEFNYQDIRQRG